MKKVFFSLTIVLVYFCNYGFTGPLPCVVEIEFGKDGTMGLGKPIHNKIVLPIYEVPGENYLPAIKPQGFQRANFIAMHSTFVVWGSSVIYSLPIVSSFYSEASITDRNDSSEYTIMFYGKGRGHKILEEIRRTLEKNGFKIRENMWTMKRKYDPTRYSDTLETSFLFWSVSIEGNCNIVEFRDKDCNYWVLLDYGFRVIHSKM